MRLDRWLPLASQRLAAATDAPKLEAEVLAAHAAGQTRAWLHAHPHETVHPDAEAMLLRRLSHEPLAYILGYREFYGRRFLVTPDVLVPRQDTETLVEAALESGTPPGRVLDLCTGSGCVGVTLALENPAWEVTLSDVSPAAARVAAENARLLGARCSTVCCDLLRAFRTPFALICANPPYIPESDQLPPDVRQEPSQALFAGADGMLLYRRIAAEAGARLLPGGHILLEVGAGQEPQVRAIFVQAGWEPRATYPDLAGIPRVLGFGRVSRGPDLP